MEPARKVVTARMRGTMAGATWPEMRRRRSSGCLFRSRKTTTKIAAARMLGTR
jgi:hypothetical protein